jgi:PAS domain S-box-containing protein
MEQESLVTQIALLAIENSGTSIVVTDPVGVLLYANPMFERITGYTGAEVTGRPCSFLQYDPDGRREDQIGNRIIRDAMRAGQGVTARLFNYRKSGEQFLVDLTIAPLKDSHGNVIGYVGTQQDITERVRGEQALLEVAITQSAMDMLGEIFGDFNHELRHPLSRIGITAHLMRRLLQTNDYEQITAATRTVEREISIIRTMLDRFSHLQKLYAHKPHQPKRVDVSDTLTAEISIFQARHPDALLELYVEASLPHLWLDVDEIGLMIRELLDNMLVHNTSTHKRVLVSATYDDENLLLRFSNNGLPISDEDLRHLFRPFFRGDRSRTADATRVGLGLSIAARVAEIHYGRLYLEETSQDGSTFTVQIPIEMPTVEAPVLDGNPHNILTLTQEIERLLARRN